MWEYKIITVEYDYDSQLIDILNLSGEQKWEMCNLKYIKERTGRYIHKCEVIFKRIKQ